MRWMKDLRHANKILVGESEWHKPVGIPKLRLGGNIEISLK